MTDKQPDPAEWPAREIAALAMNMYVRGTDRLLEAETRDIIREAYAGQTAELAEFKSILRGWHNSYDPVFRQELGVEEPKSELDALRELRNEDVGMEGIECRMAWEHVGKLEAEIERLTAPLSTTVDGVFIVPLMEVWVIYQGKPLAVAVASVGYSINLMADNPWGTGTVAPHEWFYSTRQAAEAAKEK